VIEPALASGRWVITDRYFLSTVAYQGARGLDWREILARSEAEFPLPDLAILFAMPVDEAIERIRARRGPTEAGFERADYLARVTAIFDALDLTYLARVDALGDVEAVTERSLAVLRDRVSADRISPD
jgi:dTMP kinase